TIAVVDLADDRSLITGMDRFQNLNTAQPPACGLLRSHADYQLWQTRLVFRADVRVAGSGVQNTRNILRCPVESFQIIPINLDGHGGAATGNRLFYAFR